MYVFRRSSRRAAPVNVNNQPVVSVGEFPNESCNYICQNYIKRRRVYCRVQTPVNSRPRKEGRKRAARKNDEESRHSAFSPEMVPPLSDFFLSSSRTVNKRSSSCRCSRFVLGKFSFPGRDRAGFPVPGAKSEPGLSNKTRIGRPVFRKVPMALQKTARRVIKGRNKRCSSLAR